MSISIKIVQRTDKVNRNQTAPIHLRLTQKSKSRYISTGVTVPLNVWNTETQQISPDYPNAGELQLKVDSARIEYEKKIKRLEVLEIEITFETLLDTNSRKNPYQTVSDYFEKLIDGFEKSGKINSSIKYAFCLSSLKKFRSMSITFDKIDKTFLTEFEQFLRKQGNAGNTIASKFTCLKSAYNKALEDGIFKPNDNPFIKFKVGKFWTKTRKRAISKDDILRLKNLELPKDSCFGYKQLSRDIFLFSYYTAGINFKDIATLRFNDIENGRVQYSRHKTGKLISCQLLPDAQRIVDKYGNREHKSEDYIFPILDRRVHITEQQIHDRVHKALVRVNRNLKQYSEMIGLQTPITTYVARHTFATVLKRSGVNIAIISESLGHSDLATTQIYLDSFENSAIDEAMKNLL